MTLRDASPPPSRLDARAATAALSGDAVFGPLVDRVGPVAMREPDPSETPFQALLRAIVYQQLAGAAARTIHGRVVRALGERVDPPAVLAAADDALRGAGLSAAKLRAVRDLAEQVADGRVALDDLDLLGDEEVVERLIRVRGIGPWTARMYLIFNLRRPDVWPVGDLGVRNGWARVHGLEATPTPKELLPLGEPYRPWRSAVAWYCWRAVEVITPGS